MASVQEIKKGMAIRVESKDRSTSGLLRFGRGSVKLERMKPAEARKEADKAKKEMEDKLNESSAENTAGSGSGSEGS